MTVPEQTAGVDKNMALNKSQLAKLLATENLTVVHNSSARTASFDTEKRILTLPVWMNMTADVYDLLTGHEVGHALYTDAKQLVEGLKALHSKLYPNDDFETSRSGRVLHQVVNVVEDPRIEKLTKRRYPGIKAPFNRGYKILWEQGLFGAADQNVSRLSLPDRINLHFKVGTHISVPFSAEERVFVTMVENAETMDDVFAVAEAIVLHVRENPMREKPQRPQPGNRGSLPEMNDMPPDQAMEDMDDMSKDNEGGDGDEGQDGDTSEESEDEVENAPEGEGADSDPCDDGDDESESESDSYDDAAGDADDDEVAARRRSDPHEHAGVSFLVDENVIATAGRAAEDLHGAGIVVLVGPEDVLAVGREGEASRCALHRCPDQLPGGDVLHAQAIGSGTGIVLGPGVERVVRRLRCRADLEIGLAL